jgi:hypothetical protein
MKERIFRYDLNRFKKKLFLRSAMILGAYSIYFVWSFQQNPVENRMEFLTLFLPMSGLLAFFLYRSFRRQIDMLSANSVILKDHLLIQYYKSEALGELDLRDLKKLYVDTYRSYPRVILEWEDTAVSFINLEADDVFLAEVELRSRVKREPLPQDSGLLTWKIFIYLVPSFLYLLPVLIFGSGTYPYLNWKTFAVFLNVNLLVYFLYSGGEDSKKYAQIYQGRRKIVFALLIIFSYQVIVEFINFVNLL